MDQNYWKKWDGKMEMVWEKNNQEFLIVFKSKEELKIKDWEKKITINLNGMIIGGKTLLILQFKIYKMMKAVLVVITVQVVMKMILISLKLTKEKNK